MIETTNWPELTRSLSAEFRNLRGGAPEVMKAFSSIAQAALSQGALDPKTKELITLGIAIDRCERTATRDPLTSADRGLAPLQIPCPSVQVASARVLVAANCV